jgi:hypothetical protein
MIRDSDFRVFDDVGVTLDCSLDAEACTFN